MTPAPLPGVLAEIAEVAGRDAALMLALEWGGLDVHIPKPEYLTHNPRHALARLVDFGRAVRIAQRFGGGQVYLPRARRACAIYLAERGASPAEIGRRLGITPHSARRYCRAARDAGPRARG